MSTTTEVLSSGYAILEEHAQLMEAIKTNHNRRRELLASLSAPLTAGITFSDLPRRSPSPESPMSEPKEPDPHLEHQMKQLQRTDLPPEKLAKVKRYQNYVPEEETIRNDYSQQYVNSGDWPQNWVLGAELEKRFEEYPKQQKLLALKRQAVNDHAHPPTHLPLSSIQSLHPFKFDVILIDPPYSDMTQNPPYSGISWDQIAELPVPSLAADPSFVFLWVGHGSSDGLERGREVLAKWGFRRCEDIVWIKTNKQSNRGPGMDPPPADGVLTRTTEHCLMGIRGTVRRSTDGWFVHCNIDTDVILWEGDPTDALRKPPEMHSLIENFCLGTRRLEIFGRPSSLRRGWVTVGDIDDAAYELEKVNGKAWDREWYDTDIKNNAMGGRFVVPSTTEIEQLRPKSPTRNEKHHQNQNQQNQQNPGQMRLGPPGPPNQGPSFNSPMPPIQGGGMGMMVGNIPGQAFGGPGPMPMMAGGFDSAFPHGDMGMQMGMGHGMGMQSHPQMGMGMMGPGIGPGMGVMGGGAPSPQRPMTLPHSAPLRIGGGPMQNIQSNMNAGPGMMPMNMDPNMQGGMRPMGNQPMGMNMMGMGPGMGMGMGGQMPNMMGGQPGMGMVGNMPMGGPQMGGMGMGMGNNMGGMPGGMPFGNMMPNANRQWQGGPNNQGGNWNGGGF